MTPITCNSCGREINFEPNPLSGSPPRGSQWAYHPWTCKHRTYCCPYCVGKGKDPAACPECGRQDEYT